MPSPKKGAKGAAPQLVWVRAYGKACKVSPYTAARVVGHQDGKAKVVPDGGGEASLVNETDLMQRNPPGARPDNCQLLHLNEACVLENVAVRYASSEIYTWTSHVLTAVNPYEILRLYGDEIARDLPGLNARELPPHAFSVAELAVRNVVKGSQAIIVSGESGAGKTFNMAHIMAYLTRRARNGGAADGGLGVRLGTLLLQSNPVLEAFGNAQTVRNHNSSRFGKFVKVVFDASGTKMATMTLKTYLLEKVRVVTPAPNERTYHVYYALLAGASKRDRTRWGLREQHEHALTAAAPKSVFSDMAADMGNANTYTELGEALTSLTVRPEEQTDLLGLVAAILHLRDVRFVALDDAEGGCRAVGSAALAHAVKLLGCPGLVMKFVQRVVIAGREQEPITVSLSATQAGSARDALCKAVYVALFEHICRRFNEAAATIGAQIRAAEHQAKKDAAAKAQSPSGGGFFRRKESDSAPSPEYRDNYAATSTAMDAGPFIGLLDIFGFEVFEVNSFEQLCINLANERLQGYFQQCVFAAEEEVHRLEGVPWPTDLEYHDNRGCIALITNSIFSMLDEACSLQNSTEAAFFSRVAASCGRDPFFAQARRRRLKEDEGFIVRHFAGDVCYVSASAASSPDLEREGGGSGADKQALIQASADTWLVKNADRLLPELASELRGSSSPLVATLFAREQGDRRGGTKTSVVRRFCSDLDALLLDLSQTYSRFIRCIKPNGLAAPKVFERPSVLAQLRCLGMTDVVKLMHQAYPTRIPYSVLHGRYATGMPPVLAKLMPRDFCEAVALVCEVPPQDMHLGTTRLFLRGGKGDFLEDLAEMDLSEAMPLLLKKIETMNKRRAAGKIVACAVRTYYLKTRYQRRKTACALIVRIWRGALARSKTREGRRKLREENRSTPARLAAKAAAAAKHAAEAAAQEVFAASLKAYHMCGGSAPDGAAVANGSSYPGASAAAPDRPPAPAPAPSNLSGLADEALYSSLGVKPLTAAQFRAVHALRQRLGEHVAENTSVAGSPKRAPMRAPGADASQPQLDLPVPVRRRLNAPGEHVGGHRGGSIATNKQKLPQGLPPWLADDEKAGTGTKLEVALSRDARDGTLGIDLDQFTGKPTVAVVVPGGPAERDGTVRAGDIILAVDGVACSSIGEVIAVLSSPAASVKNPLSVQLLRKAKFAVADDLLYVRALHSSSAADGIAGISGGLIIGSSQKYGSSKSGGLQHLNEWTQCRCSLMSDRRLVIAERSRNLNAALDLRAMESVQLVITPLDNVPTDAARRSCLQVRTPDGIIELSVPNPTNGEQSVLLTWQRPLEDMLMTTLASTVKGWLHHLEAPGGDLSAARFTGSRIFLDLNTHNQMRTIVDSKDARNSHVGTIELVELQKVDLVDLPVPPTGNERMRNSKQALSISTAESTCLLVVEDQKIVKQWSEQLDKAHKAALVSLVQYTGMILIDGWLEYQGDEDEWASGFFILTIGAGLQCFEDAVTEPMLAEAIEAIPLEHVTGAVRSKGIDYYDWCIDVRTTDGDYIRVRPPRQAEMTRWLATINLYCTPPPKKKPERPKRRSSAGLERQSTGESSPGSAASPMGGALEHSRSRRNSAPQMVPGQFDLPTSQLGAEGTGALPMWGGAGAAMEEATKGRHRPMQLPSPDKPYPGLLAGWQEPAPPPPPTERPKMTRANSFGRRAGRALSFTRKSDPAPASENQPSQIPAPVGPSRGGRLRSAKPKAGAPSSERPSGVGGLLPRRPSFSRRRQVKTEGDLLTASAPVPPPPNGMPLEVSLPGERNGVPRPAPVRSRAMSFTRVRRAKPEADIAEPPRISPPAPPAQLQAQAALAAPAPAPAPAKPKPERAESFGRKLARRASSFTRRKDYKRTSDA